MSSINTWNQLSEHLTQLNVNPNYFSLDPNQPRVDLNQLSVGLCQFGVTQPAQCGSATVQQLSVDL